MNQARFVVNALDYACVKKPVCGKKATIRGKKMLSSMSLSLALSAI